VIYYNAKVLLKHFHNGIKGQKVFKKLIKSLKAAKKELKNISLKGPYI